jgi:amino acid transporter
VAEQSKGFGYERLGEKKLSLVDVIAQSVGFIGPVFSAAFLIPLIAGFSASGKGAGVATPFAVILAAVGVFALGWIVAQYARRVHAAGSLYDYVSMGLGNQIGAIAGWVYYGGTTVLASAIACLVGWVLHDVILVGTFGVSGVMPVWAWDLLFVVAVFLIMYLGVQISTRVQLALALVSAAVVLVFFVYVITQVPVNSLKAFNPAEAADGWTGILFGVLYGVLIFVGFETAANLAEETAQPKHSIPRAVLSSVFIVTVFYVIAAYAQVAGFGFDVNVITDPNVAAAPLFALGSPEAVGGYGSDFILKLLEIVVLLDIMAVGLGAATASTRGVFALGRDRRIPGALATVSAKRGTPVGAIVFVELVSLVMVLLSQTVESLFALPGQSHFFAMFAWLSTFGGFALMVVYGFMSLGAFRGLADHPSKVGVWIAGLIGVAISVGAIYGAIYKVPAPTNLVPVYAAIWLVLGIVVTLAVRGREPASQVLEDLRSEGARPAG